MWIRSLCGQLLNKYYFNILFPFGSVSRSRQSPLQQAKDKKKDLKLSRPAFDPRPLHVKFLAKKVALRHIYLLVIRFYLSIYVISSVFHSFATDNMKKLWQGC